MTSTDPSASSTAASVALSTSEIATVRQALALLLDTLDGESADQIDEVQALLARLPAAPAA